MSTRVIKGIDGLKESKPVFIHKIFLHKEWFTHLYAKVFGFL